MMEEFIELVKEQLDCGDTEITAETKFKDDLGADSLDLFELAMAAEDQFGVSIPSEDFAKMETVGDVAAYLESNK